MQPARIIIVIEDNALDIVLLRQALDKQGEDYELEILGNGEEALRFVQEHRTHAYGSLNLVSFSWIGICGS